MNAGVDRLLDISMAAGLTTAAGIDNSYHGADDKYNEAAVIQ
jgi:hypothetical protein